MAEEPQPSTVKEGASEPHAPTASAEDRKAAAALSSLDAQDDEGAGKKEVDSKALDSAMKNLSVDGKEVKKVEKKAAVKIDPESVKELMHELDLPKQKATDLLKQHGGDVVQTMIAYIKPTV